ncbi:hypothetical protein J1N35_015444 [Gossypium stocksii]|uniref:Uncharacterized protein n=1 Tax=Gossypium stocksii TaxID=47602 RepID=A0A9D4A8K7_9ROSI|nr:hypothetical protein J1N35_015444 [Gossypium stocksii]
MLSALENREGNLEESLGDMKVTLELIEGCTYGFDLMEEKIREFVLDSLGANAENMNGLVHSTVKNLAERGNALEDMVLAMKKEIEELKGEFTIYKAALSNGMLNSRPKQQATDVPKLDKFQSILLMFLSCGGYTENETRVQLCHLTPQDTVRQYVWAFSKLMLQISDLSKKEASYWFENGLKPWAIHELHRQGIIELTIAMTEAKTFVELGPMKDKLE